MGLHRRLWIALVVLCAGGSGGASAAPPAPSPTDVYVRGSRDIPQTVERIVTDSAVPAGAAVLFTFEAATFSPPGGETGFTALYGFHQDVEKWANALAEAGAKQPDRPLFVATSAKPEPLAVKDALGARKAIELLSYRWTDDPAFKRFRPAATWLADAARDAKRASKAENVVVVYVADAVPAERYWGTSADFRKSLKNGEKQPEWLESLAVDGTYFDEEDVGKAMTRAGARLFVVAPEVLFEDFTPFLELPSLPWAARPQLPDVIELPDSIRKGLGGAFPGGLPPGFPGGPPPGFPPDPPEPPPLPPGTEPPTTPGGKPGEEPKLLEGERFHSTTPTWFPLLGDRTPWCNHVPSFFGHWPYARAAAVTGGRYLFYPFAPSPWLDDCPSDARLLADLAPELVPRNAYARIGAGDLAWDTLDRAAHAVLDATPWSDLFFDAHQSSGWGSFESRRPVKLEKVWHARQRPCDDFFQGNVKEEDDWRKEGKRLLTETLPLYRKAIRDLDEVLVKIAAPDAPRVHPRARADLTLARFWFAMSRFHLHALGLYATEIERFRPANEAGKGRYVICYVDAIQMSDCLDAYDGRVITPELEEKYSADAAFFARLPGREKTQGNLLHIEKGNRDYRAKRDLDKVLKNLDPRLREDALDMIEAARRVMQRYAKTPWGWTVYYSAADTFIWEWHDGGEAMRRRRGDPVPSEPDEPETTPTEPGGGSKPGGPGSKPGGSTTPPGK